MKNFKRSTQGITIRMRAHPDFKKKFDEASERKGWTMQTTLERVLGPWIAETIGEDHPVRNS